jgi:hypothetical protein
MHLVQVAAYNLRWAPSSKGDKMDKPRLHGHRLIKCTIHSSLFYSLAIKMHLSEQPFCAEDHSCMKIGRREMYTEVIPGSIPDNDFME